MYQYTGPIDNNAQIATENVKGKTAVVTGGANGIGEAYVRALTTAGAYVVIGDIAMDDGKKLEADISNTKFVRCDVCSWDEQLAMFKAAIEFSPQNRIDIVIANAGISAADEVFLTDSEEPQKPNLKVLDINGVGALYTTKLALHYFRKQHRATSDGTDDHSLILQGSLAGYLELPGALQYNFTKFGLRGVMRDLRITEGEHNTRVNYIAPWFIKTKIMNDEYANHLASQGIEFATVENAAKAMMRFVCDSTVNGHSLAILPESWAKSGYMDLDVDDYKDGGLLKELLARVVGSRKVSTTDLPAKTTQ